MIGTDALPVTTSKKTKEKAEEAEAEWWHCPCFSITGSKPVLPLASQLTRILFMSCGNKLPVPDCQRDLKAYHEVRSLGIVDGQHG